MSYQVLARKWRPQHFAGLVGQEHVKNALANALSSNRLHHAYLFTGTRGVGKTTIARIFAKSLNCEQGVTATPCGQCSACTEIDAGNFVDLLEIDAASRTKVEDTRDLLDNVQYAPSRGRFKVYLIDEVHMLSKHSFNALLKTLEEPPPHVKFLLATTDPQKLPVTVLSRCLQFNLLALSPAQIEQHLAFVLGAEQIPFEQAALTLLARAAKGSLRDSLSLTDQAIAQSDSNITLDAVRTMLGFLDQSWAQQLLQAIVAQDAAALQTQLQALVQQQSNFAQVLDDMLSLLHVTALAQFSQGAAVFAPQQEFILQLAATLAPAQVQLYYQLLISGKKELPYAPDPLTGLEMALLRAMAFVPQPAENTAPTPRQGAIAPVATATAAATSAPAPASLGAVSAVQQHIASHKPDNPAPAEAAAKETSAEQTASPAQPHSSTAADNSASSNIDPATARIMARRGVQVTAAPPEKKTERPQAAPNKPAPEPEPEPELAKPSTAVAAPRHTTPAAPDTTSQAYQPDNVEERTDDDAYDPALADMLWQHYEQDMQHSLATSTDSDSVATLSPEAVAFDGSINEENFSIRFAAQVDAWAARVETLDTGGLSRLFLLNAAMQLDGTELTLTVAQSQQHLDSSSFRIKLQQVLEHSFKQALNITIQYQPEVANSPLAIQQNIVQQRFGYVSRLLQQDDNVQQLQKMFDAELLTDTIIVN